VANRTTKGVGETVVSPLQENTKNRRFLESEFTSEFDSQPPLGATKKSFQIIGGIFWIVANGKSNHEGGSAKGGRAGRTAGLPTEEVIRNRGFRKAKLSVAREIPSLPLALPSHVAQRAMRDAPRRFTKLGLFYKTAQK